MASTPKQRSRFCRHFLALSRKNLILWTRNPTCSIFELVLPVLLMSIIWWLRVKVPIKHTDLVGLEKYKHPLFPALMYEDSEWVFDPNATNALVRPFMKYVDYAPDFPAAGNHTNVTDGAAYESI